MSRRQKLTVANVSPSSLNRSREGRKMKGNVNGMGRKILSFTIVGLVELLIKTGSTFSLFNIFERRAPYSSFPITEKSTASPPRLRIFLATFAAPPGIKFLVISSMTGTGASGESLSDFPYENISIMLSPTIAILVFLISRKNFNSVLASKVDISCWCVN